MSPRKSKLRTAKPAPQSLQEDPGRRRVSWLLALAGGLAGGLAYDPFCLRVLIPLAPLLLFAAMRLSPTPAAAFRRVLAGAWLFCMIAISWLTTLARFNIFAPVGVAFLALYMAFYPAAIAWGVRKWRGGLRVWPQFALFASLWLLAEWFRTLGRLSMPFTQLGHAWAPCAWAIQWADTFGESGVSTLVIILAGALLLAVRAAVLRRPALRARAWLAWTADPGESAGRADLLWLGWIVGVFCAMLLGSIWKYNAWERRIAATPETETLAVAAIQPNIDQETKMATNMEEDDTKREALLEQSNRIHEDLVRTGVPPETDLLVMPESTYSSFEFVFDEALHARIVEMMRPLKADLIFGADRINVLNKKGDYEAFNTAWFLRSGSPLTSAQYQDKVRLVPFGEYLPYFDMIPGLQTLVGIGSFNEGRKMTLFETHGHRIGALVCFESTFGSQSREFARLGGEALAIMTNDAWYGISAGPPQHHHLSYLRAVETRRPVIRCANTGISSLISPSGRATASLELGKQGVLLGRIAPQKSRSLYVLWGNWPLMLALSLKAAVLMFAPRRRWMSNAA